MSETMNDGATAPAGTIDDLQEEEKSYPTPPDQDGWFYEAEGDEKLGIETKTEIDPRDNENVFKRVALTNGRKCLLRELNGPEGKKAKQIAGINSKTKDMSAAQDRLLAAYVATGGEFFDRNGEKLAYVMEDILAMKLKDTSRLEVAAAALNF